MLRLNEIKLPLDHNNDALVQAIINKLAINNDDLISFTIFKRSHDARKRNHILLIYQLDVLLKEDVETTVLE